MTNPLTSDQRRAFLSAPDPRRYYAASSIEEARQRIVRAIARCEGPALIIGPSGAGKSLLLAVLAEQFEPRVSVVRLPGAQLCTRRALLQMILSELRLPYRHMDEGELRLSILEHLRGAAASAPRLAPAGEASRSAAVPGCSAPPPRRMLVLVDEADALPTRLLEELRVLTNVVSQGMPQVAVVLAGSPTLEERFADPQLDMFSQRLSCRCYLAPFTREETFQYVRSQVSAVGVKPDAWFDPEALAAVHAATGGAQRLVNQLCDQLVWLIEETGCQPLDAVLVQQAWSDLQQLPAPWNTDAPSSLASSPSASVGDFDGGVIEFGELDEPPAAPQRARDVASRSDAPQDVFVGHVFQPPVVAPDPDDDMPASIPMSSVRSRRNADLGAYAAAIDATEELVDQLDEFACLELALDPPAPEPPAEPAPPTAAENPFAEPFAEEEILVDPYADFETQFLRSARRVLNRVDATFAAELARCHAAPPRSAAVRNVSAPSAEPATGAVPQEQPPAPAVNAPSPALRPASQDLLIVEDDGRSAATPTPARQLRRLFTSLEAAQRSRQA